MFLRPASPEDSMELEQFTCARPERPFEVEVQDFCRQALAWAAEADDDERVVLVIEDDGEIVGVVIHEDDDGDRFVNALAVRTDRQGQGIAGLALRTLLDDIAEARPHCIVTWLVAPANFASHALSESVGADATSPPETKPYALYSIRP